MNTHIIVDWIFIVGFAFFIGIPFDKKRIRASWAKLVFVAGGIIGVADGAVRLTLDMRWFVLASDASYGVHRVLNFTEGMLLGFISSLIFSRQLHGTKAAVDRPAETV